MISNSGSDERNLFRGGKAGDQTGTEWRIRDFYSRPWDAVLRHPDAEVREMIATLGEKAARNDYIGYDQGQRDTYWIQLQKVGYDPSLIKTPCEADCSAGLIANVRAVGYILGIKKLQNLKATYTGNMILFFRLAGFEVLTDDKYLKTDDYDLRGDILLNSRYHTATNLDNGKKVKIEASAPVSVTGKWDRATTLKAQYVFGTTIDGTISNQPKDNKKFCKNCAKKTWKFKANEYNDGSQLIKAIQRYLKIKKIYKGQIDGWCGKNTIKGIQNLVGVKQTGYMNKNTIKQFKIWLNKQGVLG